MIILFVGDVVGKPGRICLEAHLQKIQREFSVDFTIVNAENAAGGLGATSDILHAFMDWGADAITMGNHTWRKKELIGSIGEFRNVARPANYAPGTPGRGDVLVEGPNGHKVGIVNVLGRIFMEPVECPFRSAKEAVERLSERTHTIVVDIHAEATSEKVALGWYLDGQCSAVVGTHTHIQTADERVLPRGTAYITDVGMTGPRDSVIGVRREAVIDKFVSGMPRAFDVANEPAHLNAVIIETDDATGRAVNIERVQRF